jgi:protein SCO1/2
VLAARVRLTLIALTLCALAGVAGVLLALQRTPDPTALELTNGWAGAERPPHQPIPDFALQDQDGKTISSASLKGHPVVFAFIYSTCKDTCPAQVQTIRGALDDVDKPGVRVIGISVDPANDTPKRAQTFLLNQSMAGRMDFLLGTRQQLQPIWNAFSIQPQQRNLEHTSHTVLADRKGFQRIGFPFEKLTDEALAHDLARLEAQ